jgi:hypothetical protein
MGRGVYSRDHATEEPMIRRNAIAAAAFLAAALAGCAPVRLSASSALSKSKGTVRFERTRDRGTRIIVKVENLAEPEGLPYPGYVYVAWVQSDPEFSPHNVGALAVDDYREGTLRTETPLREFRFFLTAEASRDVRLPTGPPLLWARRDDPDKPAVFLRPTQFALDDGR